MFLAQHGGRAAGAQAEYHVAARVDREADVDEGARAQHAVHLALPEDGAIVRELQQVDRVRPDRDLKAPAAAPVAPAVRDGPEPRTELVEGAGRQGAVDEAHAVRRRAQAQQ